MVSFTFQPCNRLLVSFYKLFQLPPKLKIVSHLIWSSELTLEFVGLPSLKRGVVQGLPESPKSFWVRGAMQYKHTL